MVCIKCRQGHHAACPSYRVDPVGTPITIEKTWCDCQHANGLVNWVGMELEQREQAEESSGDDNQEDTD